MLRAPLSERFTLFENGCNGSGVGEGGDQRETSCRVQGISRADLVIVGRLGGGAGLAGGLRATGHLGPVDRDRVGRLPSADGYGGWGFRRGGVDRVTLFDGTLSRVRSELG